MQPDHVGSSLEDIQRLARGGQRNAAEAGCLRLIASNPDDPRVWSTAAELAVRFRDLARASEYLRRGVERVPHDTALHLRLVQTLLHLGRTSEALAFALRAERLESTDPRFQDLLGALLTRLEEPVRALSHFERAVAAEPANIGYRYNLAMAQRMVGALTEAESNLDQVIAARPYDGEAHHARSDLRRQTLERNHVESLERALARAGGGRPMIPVAFALAKELEDLGEHSRAFERLEKACRAYRASLRYDVSADVAVLERLRTRHTLEALARIRSDLDTESCIFIIGLPRSGTTLVERILGSHSQVHAAGELDAFPRVVIQATATQGHNPPSKLDLIDRCLDLDMAALGCAYLQATRPRAGPKPKFTDKLPLNYLYAGLIHAALPRARFVALNRHPMDSCYAMYRTLFAAAYPFSYDLGDLGRYFVAWRRLMSHWQSVIGTSWLSVDYEALVADPENVTRRIVAHCGLSWEPQCLEFHSRAGGVTTASAAQVRRPISAESVGKWRHYARQLEPLARYLEDNGVTVR